VSSHTKDPVREQLLDAALAHVPFDGWTDVTFRAAMADADVSSDLARIACPRGATDLAAAYHLRGDEAIDVAALPEGLRYSQKVAGLVRLRLEAVDREIVRKGMALFSLPHLAPEGSRLVWGTADAIWNALGDTSRDYNWYTKRAMLAGVFGSTCMFWLGDQSEGGEATWAFLDRRVANVMSIEKTKAKVRENKGLAPLLAVPSAILGRIKAPAGVDRTDVPG